MLLNYRKNEGLKNDKQYIKNILKHLNEDKGQFECFQWYKASRNKRVFLNVLQWIESFNNRLKKKVKNSQQTTYQKQINKHIHTKRRKMQQKEISEVKRIKEKNMR